MLQYRVLQCRVGPWAGSTCHNTTPPLQDNSSSSCGDCWSRRPCSPEKIAMAALLKEFYVALVIEAKDIRLHKINSVPWNLLLQWCTIHTFLLKVPNLAAPSDLPGILSVWLVSMEHLHVESTVPATSSHPCYGCSRAGLRWRRTPSSRWSFEGQLLRQQGIYACKQPQPCSRDRCCGS